MFRLIRAADLQKVFAMQAKLVSDLERDWRMTHRSWLEAERRADAVEEAYQVALSDAEDHRSGGPTINDYQGKAQRTANTDLFLADRLICAALGLTGEAGEFADLAKKERYHGHDPDDDRLIDELGDILWYIAEAAAVLGVTLEEVAARNIEKLERRYPEGFSAEASRGRTE